MPFQPGREMRSVRANNQHHRQVKPLRRTAISGLKAVLAVVLVLMVFITGCFANFTDEYCILDAEGEEVCCKPGNESVPECVADLVAEDPSLSLVRRSPEEVILELSVEVDNQGDDHEHGKSRLRYYRSADPAIGTGDQEIGSEEVEDTYGTRSIRVTAPAASGVYYYGACLDPVREEADTGNNCSDSEVWFVTGNEPYANRPPPPGNVRVVREGESLKIEWDPSEGASHYRVYQGVENPQRPGFECELSEFVEFAPSCELESNLTAASYVPTEYGDRSPGVEILGRTSTSLTLGLVGQGPLTYHWLITACSAAGCSAIDRNNLVSIEDETYYRVRRSESLDYWIDAEDHWESVHPPMKSRGEDYRYAAQGLRPGTAYRIAVQECGAVGCSDLSIYSAVGITEADGSVDVPAVPLGFKGEKINVSNGPDAAEVTWDEAPGATYYELWVGSDPSDLRLGETISAPLEYQRFTTPTNRAYWGEYSRTSWAVRACNKAGCSPFTGVVTIS